MKTSAIFLALLTLLIACRPDTPRQAASQPAEQTPTPSSPVSTEVSEPPFIPEGILEFRAPDGARSLFHLDIEIATSDAEWRQGLMWRKKMHENQGMLFVSDVQQPHSFWMRNTYIPLDIIYVDSMFEVVSIRKNTPVLSDTLQPSGVPARYVIEVNAGVVDKYRIGLGTRIAWVVSATRRTVGGFEVAPM